VFYGNGKKNYAILPPPPSPPPPTPPPPVEELFDELSAKNFVGHLKKISCKGMLQKKKISCKQLGDEKKFMHRKIAQPPLKYLMPKLIYTVTFYANN
jgi:hypothetical protein